MIKVITTIFFIFLIGGIIMANNGSINEIMPFFKEIPFGDKIGHFTLMGTLSFLVNLSLKAKETKIKTRKFLTGSLIVIILVTLEELTQLFIENRTFSIIDLLFDYAGIFVFGRLAKYIILSKQLKKPTK